MVTHAAGSDAATAIYRILGPPLSFIVPPWRPCRVVPKGYCSVADAWRVALRSGAAWQLPIGPGLIPGHRMLSALIGAAAQSGAIRCMGMVASTGRLVWLPAATWRTTPTYGVNALPAERAAIRGLLLRLPQPSAAIVEPVIALADLARLLGAACPPPPPDILIDPDENYAGMSHWTHAPSVYAFADGPGGGAEPVIDATKPVAPREGEVDSHARSAGHHEGGPNRSEIPFEAEQDSEGKPTGVAGLRRRTRRPQADELMFAKAREIVSSGGTFETVAELCRVVAVWLQEEHPELALEPGSIENAFRRRGEGLLDSLVPRQSRRRS